LQKLAVTALPKLALPEVILPVAINVLAEITLTLLTLPPEPLVVKLPTVVLPVTFNVPVMFAPVPVITNMFALPTALILTFPLLDGMLTLLLPLLILLVDPLATVDQDSIPEPSVCKYCPLEPPVIRTLPTGPSATLLAPVKLIVPVLVNPVSVPTLVIFGCEAVYTVPDISALPTCPDILPAGKFVKLAPLPLK